MRIYNFKDVIGNANTVRLLQKSLVKKALPHFILLSGIPGTGKSTCAEITGLYLTCDNPIDGEPCLKCKNCINNIKALQTTGASLNLIKKNLGLLNTKKDITEIIKEIFVLKGGTGPSVYIFEEIHSLSSSDQTSFLEEIDRLDSNTFIIGCTTKTYKLIPELRSRALPFNFNRLNKTESKLLFDRTCYKLGVSGITPSVFNMVFNHSKGVPRDMVAMIQFIQDTQPTKEEISKFLGNVDSSIFTQLFYSMTLDTRSLVLSIDALLAQYTPDIIIEQLKEYFLNCIFYIEGGLNETFSKEDRDMINAIGLNNHMYKIAGILEKLNSHESSENDLKFALLRIKQLINNKTLKSIYDENSQLAAVQNINAQKAYKDLEKSTSDTDDVLNKLDKTSFMKIFDGK